MNPIIITSKGIVCKNAQLVRIDRLIDNMKNRIQNIISNNNEKITSEIAEKIIDELSSKIY
jgi:ABC-type xylose transport system substrate-binding protein